MLPKLREIWDSLGLRGKVINLKGREDREKHAKEMSEKIGLAIDFFYADKHPVSGAAGCFQSHQLVCKEALERGEKRVLIFEDDFIATEELFTVEGIGALQEAVEFANEQTKWSIIYLGVLPNIWFENSSRVGKYVYKMKPWACTHAMILSEKYMKEVVSWKFMGSDNDAYDWRHRKCKDAFTIHPQAFKQMESYSDIDHSQIPTPPLLRDVSLSLASWYAMNVGVSLGNALCVFVVATITLGMSSSGSHNKKIAKTALEKLARVA